MNRRRFAGTLPVRWALSAAGHWLLRRFGVDPDTQIDFDGLDASIDQMARELGLLDA